MGKPQRDPLRDLTEIERRVLQRIVQASSEVDRVRRARVLLGIMKSSQS